MRLRHKFFILALAVLALLLMAMFPAGDMQPVDNGYPAPVDEGYPAPLLYKDEQVVISVYGDYPGPGETPALPYPGPDEATSAIDVLPGLGDR